MLGGGVAYIAAVPAVFVVLALRLGAWRTLVALIAVAHLVVLASVALFPLPVDPGLIAGGRAWAAGTAGESLNLVPFATIGPALAGVGGTGARVIALANLFVLAPAGVYLPILVPRLRSWRVFLPAALVIGGSIEAAQAAISFAARLPVPPPRRGRLDPQHRRPPARVRRVVGLAFDGRPEPAPPLIARTGRVDLPAGPAGSGRCARPRSAQNCETARDPPAATGRGP